MEVWSPQKFSRNAATLAVVLRFFSQLMRLYRRKILQKNSTRILSDVSVGQKIVLIFYAIFIKHDIDNVTFNFVRQICLGIAGEFGDCGEVSGQVVPPTIQPHIIPVGRDSSQLRFAGLTYSN